MTFDDEVPPSLEVQLEQIRRDAGELDDFALDEHLALMVARRDVAAAHGRAQMACDDVGLDPIELLGAHAAGGLRAHEQR